MSEYGYIPEAPEQSFGNNKGIFTPKDIYDLTRADKYTNYGQLELIQTEVSASSTTLIEFTNLKENEYNTHVFMFSNIQSGVGTQLSFNVFTSQYGYDTNGHYTSTLQRCNSNNSFSEFKQVNSAYSYLQGHPLSSNSNQAMNGYWYFFNLGDSNKYSLASGHTTSAHANDQLVSEFGNIVYSKTRPVTKIKFKLGGGTTAFTNGSIISLYGIKDYK